jgi:thiosulfate dehydrogenase (quinone) large subunit
MSKRSGAVTSIPEPPLSLFLFADTRLSWIWLILRVYVAWQWLQAGYEKVMSPLWVGSQAGGALTGFIMGALKKTGGSNPDVSGWYAAWLQDVVLPNANIFSHVVAFGELAVGLGLLFGLFTGIAAFFGATMNMNYLFAGTVSINPIMILIELFLILAWRVAGWIGVDRWILPLLGTPWKPGSLFKSNKKY